MNNYGDLVATKSEADHRSVLKKVRIADDKNIVHDWKKVVHKRARTRGSANGHRRVARVVINYPISISSE
jgi:hypothetical protein